MLIIKNAYNKECLNCVVFVCVFVCVCGGGGVCGCVMKQSATLQCTMFMQVSLPRSILVTRATHDLNGTYSARWMREMVVYVNEENDKIQAYRSKTSSLWQFVNISNPLKTVGLAFSLNNEHVSPLSVNGWRQRVGETKKGVISTMRVTAVARDFCCVFSIMSSNQDIISFVNCF
jgi:hypothetical protein